MDENNAPTAVMGIKLTADTNQLTIPKLYDTGSNHRVIPGQRPRPWDSILHQAYQSCPY